MEIQSQSQCPVCNHRLEKFASFGVPKRYNAKCTWCGSLERHRLIWLFFQRKTDLFDGRPKNMLHFAPERAFIEPLSKSIGGGYITADLHNAAMAQVDITDIKFPNDFFQVVYCCHVLEHIVDDIKAIRELRRVLKNNGWALIVVPIRRTRATTFEDKSITNPVDRLRIYGQEDHVRICGKDYGERLKENGFVVTVYNMGQVATKEEQVRFGLIDTTLYYCTKSGHPG